MMTKGAYGGRESYRIDRAETLCYLGYSGQDVNESLSRRVDELIERCERFSNPSWTYRIYQIDGSEGPIRLVGTTLSLPGADIFAHLHGARLCAVMAATAGLSNERELRRLTLANGLDGMIFDAAGSALVEAVADACNAAVVAEARERGLYTNWRYGPGYGDLPLDMQSQVVRVLAADKRLGISVTEANLLIPAKSITAFIGLFDTPQDGERSCSNCSFRPYCSLTKKGTPCYR